jgi:hypothetical protein
MFGCKEKTVNKKLVEEKVEFNQDLADELRKLAEVDQIAAYIPQGEYKRLSEKEWNSFKDSVFTTHESRLIEIFKENGFVGFDLVGKGGSSNFWVMVQHCDDNPEFQSEVLKKMKVEVDKGNASPRDYAYLVDRVKLNTELEQVYGTQVSYNFEICQAYVKNLADSSNVNERRKSVGLERLEEYLNSMSKSHFLMNKQIYLDKGITEPKLYKTE